MALDKDGKASPIWRCFEISQESMNGKVNVPDRPQVISSGLTLPAPEILGRSRSHQSCDASFNHGQPTEFNTIFIYETWMVTSSVILDHSCPLDLIHNSSRKGFMTDHDGLPGRYDLSGSSLFQPTHWKSFSENAKSDGCRNLSPTVTSLATRYGSGALDNPRLDTIS